jgi:hypothetical protein
MSSKKQNSNFTNKKITAINKEEEKQRKESGIASAAVLSPTAAKAAAVAAKRKAAQQMLMRGIVFNKHQAGKLYSRALWCSPSMDRLIWGDPKMETVKGFVMLDDVTEVVTALSLPTKGNVHGVSIVHNLHAFSGTDEAVLQFETDDAHARDSWVNALRTFTDKGL